MPIHSANQAAEKALGRAEQAAESGTFGVGALLVNDRTGEVLDAVSNDVVRELPRGRSTSEVSGGPSHVTHDPTAHGERQLISRFFERVRAGDRLPPPSELTIVSSLEPCVMCAGAILAAGFKVGVVALDPIAGIGALGSERFERLPDPIRHQAGRSFGYYEVAGARPFAGSPDVIFGVKGGTRSVSRVVHDACEKIFLESLERTVAVIGEGSSEIPARDPFDLDPTDPLRADLTERLPFFLSLRLPDPKEPSREVLGLLQALAEGEPGRGSSSALIDPFGNLLIASGGGPVDDPIATGFAEMIRAYSLARFELATDPALSGPARKYLSHPKFGTLIRYPIADPESPLTLFELGVYGSTMEGPLPPGSEANLKFVGKGGDEAKARVDLMALVEAMPPFYSDTVGIHPIVTCL